jgi:hypothetical protein
MKCTCGVEAGRCLGKIKLLAVIIKANLPQLPQIFETRDVFRFLSNPTSWTDRVIAYQALKYLAANGSIVLLKQRGSHQVCRWQTKSPAQNAELKGEAR